MSRIFPFRAFRYDLSNGGLKKAVCPPYDIIGEDLARGLRRDPANAIHIELPSGSPRSKYKNAKKIWEAWKKKGVVRQDSQPSFYVYEQVFKADGRQHARRGFFCALRVEKPGSGSILRHELTLSKPKEDRLNLLRALRVNTSPIFGLFKDAGRTVTGIFKAVCKGEPLAEFRDGDGVTHRLWRCSNLKQMKAMRKVLAGTDVVIADGHHRNETAWNYFLEQKGSLKRDEKNSRFKGEIGLGASAALFFLCPMEDHGLVVMPTHRVFKEHVKMSFDRVLARAESQSGVFSVVKIARLANLKASAVPYFIVTDGMRFVKVSLKSLPALRKKLPGKPDVVLNLPLVQIHSLLLPEMAKEDFTYVHKDGDAVRLARKTGAVSILVPPATTDELYRVVKAGELMPQKSTYFYPKIITGIVFRSL